VDWIGKIQTLTLPIIFSSKIKKRRKKWLARKSPLNQAIYSQTKMFQEKGEKERKK
jgi:hypothetical protein